MAEEDALDARRVAELRSLGGADQPDLLPALVTAYLTGARIALARLVEAVRGRDWRTAAGCAHDLRGSSGNMGAMALHALCTELERGAAAGEVPPGLAAAIEAELARVAAALTRAFGRSPD